MIEIDIEKTVKRWNPVLEQLKRELTDKNSEYLEKMENLTADEKICLYAELHTLNEAAQISTSGMGMGDVAIPISSTNDSLKNINNSLLPSSLKVLTALSLDNDLKDIIITGSPSYTNSKGRQIHVGDLMFSEKVSEAGGDYLEKLIHKKTLNHFKTVLSTKNEYSKIYLYLIVQNVKIVSKTNDGMFLEWTTRYANV